MIHYHGTPLTSCWATVAAFQGRGRVRKRRLLPAGWSRAQAEAYDRKESAALHAIASGIASPRAYIAHRLGMRVVAFGELFAEVGAKR